MNRIKAIFFDFDGVILDSVKVKTEAFAKLFASYGEEVVEQVVEYHLSNGGISRFEKIEYIYSNILKKNLSDNEHSKLCNKFGSLVLNNVLIAKWIPGAEEFIHSFHDKLDLFIVSGTPQDEMRKIIAQRGLLPYFKEVNGSPSAKKELCKYIMVKHSLKPREIIFIGDAMTDFDAAQSTMIKFIGVSIDQQDPFPPDTIVINDIRILSDHIN